MNSGLRCNGDKWNWSLPEMRRVCVGSAGCKATQNLAGQQRETAAFLRKTDDDDGANPPPSCSEMLTALATGILLGLAAGLSPGPLLALVLSQTLRHGPREGCKVAFTPLLTDAPLILVAVFFAARLAEMRFLLGIVSLAGGLFVLYLAWESLRPGNHPDTATAVNLPRSWSKGLLTNLLSPHPWLFWLTVGAATLATALAQHWIAAVLFLFGFYLLLVGSKVLIAVLAGRSRRLLTGPGYRLVLRLLALLLGIFALGLFGKAFKYLSSHTPLP